MSYTTWVRRMRHKCTIATVDQTDLSQRNTVLENWPCTPLYPLEPRERERWNMATTTQAFSTYIKPPDPSNLVQPRMRLLIGEKDFRIVNATPIPAGVPARIVHLVLDDEGL